MYKKNRSKYKRSLLSRQSFSSVNISDKKRHSQSATWSGLVAPIGWATAEWAELPLPELISGELVLGSAPVRCTTLSTAPHAQFYEPMSHVQFHACNGTYAISRVLCHMRSFTCTSHHPHCHKSSTALSWARGGSILYWQLHTEITVLPFFLSNFMFLSDSYEIISVVSVILYCKYFLVTSW